MPGRKPTGRPSGPPEKPILMDQVFYWASLQATAEEVAGSFHVCVDTLDNRLQQTLGMGYSELLKRVGGTGKLSLRRYQYKMAETNATMAIWLGKQWLGQKDKQLDEVEGDLIAEFRKFFAGFSPANTTVPAIEQPKEPILEIEQSLLHKKPARKKDKVQPELGTERTD